MRFQRCVKDLSFALMLVTAVVDLVAGLILSDSTANHTVASMPLLTIHQISLLLWAVNAVILAVFVVCDTSFHPISGLFHLVAILLVLGFFSTYIGFEASGLLVWGPIAVDLGIIISVGLSTVYNGSDRIQLRELLHFFLGRSDRAHNDIENGYDMPALPPRAHHQPHGDHNA